MAQAKQSTEEVRTRGVSAVHGALSDTIVALGDTLSTAVHVTGDVGEEVVSAVGRVGRTGIREAGDMLTGLASGLRGGVDALFSGRGERATGHRAASTEPGEERPTI